MSEITDLAKTIREENEKTRALNERIASGTRENGQFASRAEIDVAKETLKKQDDQRALTMQLLGISERRMKKAEELTNQIQAQEQIMAEQKSALGEAGIDADKSEQYQKEQLKLDKLKSKKDDATGSRETEDEAKAGAKDSKMLGYLKSIGGFMGEMAKGAAEKVKGGFKSISKFLFGAMLVGVLAFLNSPKFEEIKNTLIDVVVPALAYLYDEVIKPLAIYIGGLLTDLFKDLKSYVDGEKGLGAVIYDNIGIIAGIVTMLAPGLVFGSLKLAVTGLIKMIALLAKGGIFAKIGVAFTAMKTFFVGLAAKFSFAAIFAKISVAFVAIKTFFVATLMPFLAAAAIPIAIIVGVVAGIVLAIYSLKKGFDDFMFELEATGSIWEATKTGIVTVISNILGLPFDLLKDGVSWIIGKIGSIFGLESFTNASKVLDDFSFVDMMKDMLTFLGDSISGIFDGFMQAVQDFLRSGLLGKFGGSKVADKLFGTKEEQVEKKKAKEEEQKQFELNRKALKEKQKLEKEALEAEKLKKAKEQQVQASSASVDPRSLAGPGGAAAPIVVNAPATTNVSAPNTTNMSSASTSMINTDRVFDKLSAVR